MAQSKCSNCSNTQFEIVENSPKRSNYKFYFVQCSSCGSVAGVMDYFSISTLVKDAEKKVDALSSKTDSFYTLNNNLDTINKNITKLHRLIESKLDK